MTSARRPGRVQHIAYDKTPLSSSQPDIGARIALGDAGFPASRSLVSRRESGEIPISYEGMAAYESALGLEQGQISSLTGYIRAAIPGVKAKGIRPHLDVASKQFSLRLDELLDAAEDGGAGARDWQELGWHLAAVPGTSRRCRSCI